ncbi:MAG TPA: SDR family oxidoreductase [Candidatus Saccharimonadales bacterium]|nr:SDR family oxidoreductase [Candidatus Saccharimonadales bacterium]
MTELTGERYDFAGKNALVTGTSHGMGEKIGQILLSEGVHVIGNSRSGPPESFADYIASGKADYEQGDLVLRAKQVIENIYKKHGGSEILVINAGMFSSKPFFEATDEEIDAIVDLNLKVPMKLFKHWYKLYDPNNEGAKKPELAVSIASISSFYAWESGSAYQGAKAGLMATLASYRSTLDRIRKESSTGALSPRIIGIYPDNVATGLLEKDSTESSYAVKGDLLPVDTVVNTVIDAIKGQGDFGRYDDVAILVNPREPETGAELKGAYLAFLPPDDETHRPDFSARQLVMVLDEDQLIKGNS